MGDAGRVPHVSPLASMTSPAQIAYDSATQTAYAAADAIALDWGLSQTAEQIPTRQFHDAEIPEGSVDGSNATFSLLAAPSPAASLQVTRNGLTLRAGSDYSLVDRVVEFVSSAVPQPGDILQAWYRS